MRVAVLLDQLLAPVPGGTGRYSREIATALAATAAPGDTLTGWVGWTRRRALPAADVPGIGLPRRLNLPAVALARTWPAGRGPSPTGADVVFAPTPLAPPRWRRSPALVAVVHDAVPWTHPETLTPRGVRFHRQAVARLARDADAVVVPTRAVAAALAAHVALDPARLHVIGEGVGSAIGTLPPDAEARAVQLGLPPRYLLMLGTVEPRKGVGVAIEALGRPGAPDLPLLLVGRPGWGGVAPGALAAAAGLAPDRVRLLGPLPDPDAAVVLARAAALLVPSLDEGFGLPVVEAMSHGTPVVVSDVAALVETAGGAAEIVPAGDAGALALAATRAADPARRGELSVSGRAVAAGHTWTAAAAALWDLLRAVA